MVDVIPEEVDTYVLEVLNDLVPQEEKIGFSVIVFLMSKDQLISNIS